MHPTEPREVAVIRHLAFEDLGTFAPVFAERGWRVGYYEAGVDDVIEPIETADLLVVLGGPIGATEREDYPFLGPLTDALARRIARRRPTLGVCLGAQLMAVAMGGSVRPGDRPEIGWGKLTLTEAGRHSPLANLADRPVLHWHGDTFDLPAEASLHASSTLCRNQAFSVGPNQLAMQFHAEADPTRIEQWLVGHTTELRQAGISPTTIRQQTAALPADTPRTGPRLLRHWLAGIDW